MDTITITKDQLAQAIKRWEQAHRAGECIGHEAAAVKSVEEIGKESAEYLWSLLQVSA